jgi:large subunit ribosomal protein L20
VPRVRRGSKRRNRRKKILAQAKGYYQRKSKLFRYAKEAVERGQKFAYIGRRLKKRDFRGLWIIRIAAAARQNEVSYSQFVHGLKLASIDLNRKMLAEMAVHDEKGFAQLAATAKAAIAAKPAAEAPPAAEVEPAPEASAAE